MTQIFTQLTDRFSRLRIGDFAPLAKRNWSLGGARANPDLRGLNPSQNMLDQLINALRRYQISQQWQRDLQELDDRQLDDIGVSRAEAERTIGRIRFWI